MAANLLQQRLTRHGMGRWAVQFVCRLHRYYAQLRCHGDYPAWQQAIAGLAEITPSQVVLDADWIRIGSADDCPANVQRELEQVIAVLRPWRKGPYTLFGIDLDAEWRSDYKWRRLQGRISSLQGRCVLDVGCGNGYFGWRMLAAGADLVIGLDPVLRYVMQYHLIQKYLRQYAFTLLPCRLEDVLDEHLQFDTVFSMGVLYHHPAPETHLRHVFDVLRPGGELILETLIVDDSYAEKLRPTTRYARMKNISIIPSIQTLTSWLTCCGYRQAMLADVSRTTPAEQRVTRWSGTQSLINFLDKNDNHLTIEGYPAPQRAILIAQK